MTSETKTETAAPQDTWKMASAILVALHQAHLKAQAEYQALAEVAQGNPFAPGVLGTRLMIETLKPALRMLEADMNTHARSSGLQMPNLKN